MTRPILKVPYGTRDVLPGEALLRSGMESRLARLFDRWGYDEVETPSLEYLDTFDQAGQDTKGAFKLIEAGGGLLMLRTEMTTPIARLVATRMAKEKGIRRLSYRARVFRQEEIQAGRRCEFSQCGIEMMGADGVAADAEVVALAVNALLEAGIMEFSITLGHMEFINGLLEEAGAEGQLAEGIRRCLIERNVADLKELLAASDINEETREIFAQLLFFHGGKKMLDALSGKIRNKRCLAALRDLEAIYELCRAYGVERYLTFDLGLMRGQDYYTGMIFEGYAAGMGYSIIGGGRYDNMMAKFGLPLAATGFAVGMERLVLTLERQGLADLSLPGAMWIGYGAGSEKAAVELATKKRAEGQRVKMAPSATTREKCLEEAVLNRCDLCEYVSEV